MEWALGRHGQEGMPGRSKSPDDMSRTNVKIDSGQG
jgi:hypothetical protein